MCFTDIFKDAYNSPVFKDRRDEKLWWKSQKIKKKKAKEEGKDLTPMLERAERVAHRIEEANVKTEELLMRKERLAIERTLGGRGDAGEEAPPEKTEEQKIDEEAKAFIKAVGMDVE